MTFCSVRLCFLSSYDLLSTCWQASKRAGGLDWWELRV